MDSESTPSKSDSKKSKFGLKQVLYLIIGLFCVAFLALIWAKCFLPIIERSRKVCYCKIILVSDGLNQIKTDLLAKQSASNQEIADSLNKAINETQQELIELKNLEKTFSGAFHRIDDKVCKTISQLEKIKNEDFPNNVLTAEKKDIDKFLNNLNPSIGMMEEIELSINQTGITRNDIAKFLEDEKKTEPQGHIIFKCKHDENICNVPKIHEFTN